MRKLRTDGRPIDIAAHLDELRELLAAEPGLVAGYVFGSYGTPAQTPLSDVDLALVFRPHALPGFRGEIELIGRVTALLREEDVSITVLNRAPVLFQHRVLGHRPPSRLHGSTRARGVSRGSAEAPRGLHRRSRALHTGVRPCAAGALPGMSARAVDRERVRQKVQFIRDRSRHLRDIQAAGLERFLSEDVLQAAALDLVLHDGTLGSRVRHCTA